eukprot:GHVR01004239.1.p1 GENE.GHVR01004239.1~~GHVR01004239.1.p1  ORF type:complete len:279 (-),score=19.32 GHVR01004239.1:485-1321(-)
MLLYWPISVYTGKDTGKLLFILMRVDIYFLLLCFLLLFAIIVSSFALWYMLADESCSELSSVKRALIIFAHPDDEAMFFSPLLKFLSIRNSADVHLLCLSTGNYDGNGKIREKELFSSASVFNIKNKDKVHLVDNKDMEDGWEQWDTSVVEETISLAVNDIRPDAIFTFDIGGVSGHPNHISVALGVHRYSYSKGKHSELAIYELRTLPLIRKFGGPLCWMLESGYITDNSKLVSVCCRSCMLSMKALYRHWSQFVWYRWLFVIFSSYSYVNIFNKVK